VASSALENEAARKILDRIEGGESFGPLPTHLWERDLLKMAQDFPVWRDIAHCVGFTDEKIDAPWLHADEGRKVEMPEFAVIKVRGDGNGNYAFQRFV
jgi:hypothetical protein